MGIALQARNVNLFTEKFQQEIHANAALADLFLQFPKEATFKLLLAETHPRKQALRSVKAVFPALEGDSRLVAFCN
jgi:hypothetical protein